MCLQYKSFKNVVEQGEIARYEQFLPFPIVFSTWFEELSVNFIKFEIVICKLF